MDPETSGEDLSVTIDMDNSEFVAPSTGFDFFGFGQDLEDAISGCSSDSKLV